MKEKKQPSAPAGGPRRKHGKRSRMLLIATAATSFCVGFAAGFLLSPVKNGILNGQKNYFTYTGGEGKLPDAVARAITESVKEAEPLPDGPGTEESS